ncbi:hypothetical protein G7Y89_g4795 [Cudoniella acicularis]|uniref:2EXR domain-containing protein n=1 Tax=Cudoniella acicularis TaxID=354080 RepID=A0A8H4RNR2_9HELO|nr:hypothetical protein G7Y89_g4795 [Cudoniella acicularis]
MVGTKSSNSNPKAASAQPRSQTRDTHGTASDSSKAKASAGTSTEASSTSHGPSESLIGVTKARRSSSTDQRQPEVQPSSLHGVATRLFTGNVPNVVTAIPSTTSRCEVKSIAAASKTQQNLLQNSVSQPVTLVTTTVLPNGQVQSQVQQQQAIVQIPTDVLTSLLTSVKTLHEEISLLRNHNVVISNQITAMATRTEALQSQFVGISAKIDRIETNTRSHMFFTCFNRLQIELHLLVWKFALSQPEIHALMVEFENTDGISYVSAIAPASRTLKHAIRQVNREARKAATVLLCYIDRRPFFYNPSSDAICVEAIVTPNVFAELKAHGYSDNELEDEDKWDDPDLLWDIDLRPL